VYCSLTLLLAPFFASLIADSLYGTAYDVLSTLLPSFSRTEIFSHLRSKGLGLSYDSSDRRSLALDDLLALQEGGGCWFEFMRHRGGEWKRGWRAYMVGKEWGLLEEGDEEGQVKVRGGEERSDELIMQFLVLLAC